MTPYLASTTDRCTVVYLHWFQIGMEDTYWNILCQLPDDLIQPVAQLYESRALKARLELGIVHQIWHRSRELACSAIALATVGGWDEAIVMAAVSHS